jgi:inhibitor of KinA
MKLTPLGDQAVLAVFSQEVEALRFAAAVRAAELAGIIDIVPAYVSVAIFYNLARTRYSELLPQLEKLRGTIRRRERVAPGRRREIPCCYELGPDLEDVARQTRLAADEVIRLHTGTAYTVYAIGFCPGFPYLGYLPDPLCGLPRLPTPRVRVEPGSVGLTGRQTGIYPLERPGGWKLIGRTPLELVNLADGYFPLRPGDQVRFVRIDQAEFQRRSGGRL